MCKLRHVTDHIVHAVATERVPLRHHCGTGSFLALLAAPRVGICEKEGLQLSEAVFRHGVEIFALSLQLARQAPERDMDTAIVGGIFSSRQFAILLNACFGYILCV